MKLFQPDRAFGLPNPSAFCVKLETYLRMAEIDYEFVIGDPREAPKGKVPWIEDDGEVLGDSTFVINHLKQKYGNTVDGHLTKLQQATGHAIQKMLEDSLYYVSSHSKWVDDAGFAIYSAQLFAGMPAEQLEYIPPMVRKKVIEKLTMQGIARHSHAEVHELGIQDVQAFGEILGDNQYLFGDQPSSFDACALGVIGNIKDGPFVTPVRDVARNTQNIAAYIDRMRQQYFADLS